jgi:hypothetical protein
MMAKDEVVSLQERRCPCAVHAPGSQGQQRGSRDALRTRRGGKQGRHLLPGQHRASKMPQANGQFLAGSIRQ